MSFLYLSTAVLSAAAQAAAPQVACPLPGNAWSKTYVFTNADLERMAACRYQTGVDSERGAPDPGDPKPGRAVKTSAPASGPRASEADWRARWRSVDQKVRRLKREARELRQEAADAPRDPRKRPTGRRAPSVLIARAESLEAEAREIEDAFQLAARRAGALPGWLRP